MTISPTNFTPDEQYRLAKLLTRAFAELPRTIAVHDVPGTVYTKVRTQMPMDTRLHGMFIGQLKDLNYRLTDSQKIVYKALYARAYEQWIGGLVDIPTDAMDKELLIVYLEATATRAAATAKRAQTIANEAETVTNQLEELEHSLKGD